MCSIPASVSKRSRLLQLDFTAIDPNHSDTTLPDDTAHRPADPATDIDDRHALAQFQLGNHQPLVPDFGVLQALHGR